MYMKNYFKVFSMLVVASIFVLSSCEKKSDETKSTTEYLTAGNWKVTGMTVDPGFEFSGIIITDIYKNLMEDCTKDDLIKFNIDGTVTDDEGATKCDPDDPQTTDDGTWTLTNDDKTITIMYPGEDPAPATIVSINGSTLVVSAPLDMDFGLGTTGYTATVTMTLQ
jgi:hypothetical protein